MNGYSTFTEMLALNYMITKKIPYILYINGGIIKKSSNLKDKLKRKYISNACAYFSPCQEANNFLRFYGAKNKIFNYPYSTVKELELMPKLQPSAKQDVRSKFKIEGEKTFVYAGQFIERKNNLQLLKIWKDVPKSYTLYLIGQGKQQKELEKAIKKYKLSNVFIREFLIKKDMLQFFRGCDVFITLSKEDIYGHMINEALSQSLPVISSKNVIAASHLIKNNYNGFIVDLDDEKSIINAIKKA